MFPAISRDATYSRPVCGESFCILWLQNDGAYRLSAQFSLNQQAVWGASCLSALRQKQLKADVSANPGAVQSPTSEGF